MDNIVKSCKCIDHRLISHNQFQNAYFFKSIEITAQPRTSCENRTSVNIKCFYMNPHVSKMNRFIKWNPNYTVKALKNSKLKNCSFCDASKTVCSVTAQSPSSFLSCKLQYIYIIRDSTFGLWNNEKNWKKWRKWSKMYFICLVLNLHHKIHHQAFYVLFYCDLTKYCG